MTGAQRLEFTRLAAGPVLARAGYTALYTVAATVAAITTFKLAFRYGGL
ncbi:hypothetical protein [Tsukamurella asaccharolytica]|nr:hypothetical protein [Tsukamurella asaccharolytica]